MNTKSNQQDRTGRWSKLAVAVVVWLVGTGPAAANAFSEQTGAVLVKNDVAAIGFGLPGSFVLFSDGAGGFITVEGAQSLIGLNSDPLFGFASPATLDLSFGLAIIHGPQSTARGRGLTRDGETVGMSVGHGARGSLVISGGGVFHIGVPTDGGSVPAASNCCDNFVANAVGSAGQVVVRNDGSNLTLFSTDGHGGNLVVGNGIFQAGSGGFPDFGEIGATTVATVEVLQGGELIADNLSIGPNFGEKGPMIATFTVSGADTQPAVVDISGFVTVGGGFGASPVQSTTATLNVLDGGIMTVGGMAVGGTVGAVNVLGAGSLLDTGPLLTIANDQLLPGGTTFMPGGDSRVTLCQGTIAADTINIGVAGTLRFGGFLAASTMGATQTLQIDGELIIGCSTFVAIVPGACNIGGTGRVRMEVLGTEAEEFDQLNCKTLSADSGAVITVDVAAGVDAGSVAFLTTEEPIEDTITVEITATDAEGNTTTVQTAEIGAGSTTATITVDESGDVSVAPSAVLIDIKPGEEPNSINLGSNGVVPVAILSTESFDAASVDPLTVSLASARVRIKGKGLAQASLEDVNGDGLPDLVVKIETDALELSGEAIEAVLTATTFAGVKVSGSDLVRVVN